NDVSINVLKTAILLERRGKAFYTHAANMSENSSVKKIFEMMAEEENAHIDFLVKQFKSFSNSNRFLEIVDHPEEDDSMEILTENVKAEISAAGFEAAAISAAIDFENRAIEVYRKRADEATDKNEKEMYKILASWEAAHHHLLYKLNEDLKEKIWDDNNFWPF
ncbi:MAG TPA: ferritin family protein, partial [Bacteroidales bacterium]|nr:ferritin family protein [Bacteroidales bacterium]